MLCSAYPPSQLSHANKRHIPSISMARRFHWRHSRPQDHHQTLHFKSPRQRFGIMVGGHVDRLRPLDGDFSSLRRKNIMATHWIGGTWTWNHLPHYQGTFPFTTPHLIPSMSRNRCHPYSRPVQNGSSSKDRDSLPYSLFLVSPFHEKQFDLPSSPSPSAPRVSVSANGARGRECHW
jgi:hypothetical protein